MKDDDEMKGTKDDVQPDCSAKASSQQPKSSKKRKSKEIAIFGNYRNYYGYRIDQELKEDPRIKVLKKEWFEGKDCLDIGCNSGVITITIAKKFCCRSILGIDIDSARIEDAYWNLRNMKMSDRKMRKRISEVEGAGDVNGVQHLVNEPPSEDPASSIPLDNVSFRKENFVQSSRPSEERYDTIICFSVTKWIHLNWGDDGLITLFSKIWRLLQPGGVFILEPQPWISYKKNHQVSEIASHNYFNIKLHPECFQDILLDKIGFRTVENITSRLPGSKSGFDRPILAFWK
ncbi:hypothetical protein RJ639_018689 [Escallonia herrerae]|uniref:RNA methyltransferase n=1 Tax=Escallonia herrerae TaxID=1293975 RepID=A0AA88V802_9ASTE|nr:hypothetical protein RJ639_018689 [Escallonia herrerae]